MSDIRIVSLVPSVTELVCDLGLEGELVGRTGFCIHPWESVRGIPKVGGTKDVKLDLIRELRPTHVIVNIDENRREDAEALAEFVPHVVVTHPLGPLDNLQLYRQLGRAFERERQAEALCAEFERSLAGLQAEHFNPQNVLYLIWRDPWMTISPDTYISRALELLSWRTLPTTTTERYPTVDPASLAGQVDRVLLSSEPYHFKERHREEIREVLPGTHVSLIDGEMTSWYGSRAIAGLRYLARYARVPSESSLRFAR